MAENYFDICTESSTSNEEITSLDCTNFLNDQINFLVGDMEKHVANCYYHQCFVNTDFTDSSTKIIACSGVILHYDSDSFLNPLVGKKLKTESARQLPRSIVDPISMNMDYYYIKDVRTTFDKDIDTVTCSDNLRTVINFKDGTMVVWGNTDNIAVLHGDLSFVIAASVVVLAYALIKLTFDYYLELRYDYSYKRPIKLFVFTLLVFIGIMLMFVLAIVEVTSVIIGLFLLYIIFIVFEYREDISKRILGK